MVCCRVKLTNNPDGTVKLEIENASPADSGAYKLVLSNPNGENVALCAVAVKRKYRVSYDSYKDLLILKSWNNIFVLNIP